MHWQIPTTMLSALVVGVIFSVGHHFFYQSLDGKFVESNFQQTWNIRIGTGIAFIVQVLFVVAVGIACVQHAWLVLHRKSLQLSAIDGLFVILGKPIVILSPDIWRNAPLVCVLAVTSWCIPLASIVTPASLTVELSESPSAVLQSMKVPLIDWYNITSMAVVAAPRGVEFLGTQTEVTRLALEVGTSASLIPTKNPPAPNATYTLEFEAPSLKCREANQDIQTQVSKMLMRPLYISWVGGNNLTQTFNIIGDYNKKPVSTCDDTSKDQMRLYFATSRILECGLYNSSFVAEFRFENGAQEIHVLNETIHNEHPFRTGHDKYTSPWTDTGQMQLYSQSFGYQALMDAFGNLLVGSANNGNVVATHVLFTSLANARELNDIARSRLEDKVGIGAGRNFTLQEGVEEIFRNLTFSLFSDSRYLQRLNETAPVDVYISSPRNVYRYERRNLLLAYGIAILFSVLGVFLGIAAMKANGASFENNFSTVLRVSRHPELSDLILPEDTTGAVPLPRRLEKIRLGVVRLVGLEKGVYQSLAVESKEKDTSNEQLKGSVTEPGND